MSSTVTYKGSTLATVSNATKKLNTSGKYMEDDVTIVDVSQATPVLQTVSKSYTPSETAQSEDVTAGSGYDGLEKVSVSVGAISSSYVGSGITRRSSSDMTASGATVTAPAGYYSASASKAVASGSATAPSTISSTGATVSTSGTSTLTLSKSNVSVTPTVSAGYVSSGTAGNSTVSLSASVNIRTSSNLTASGDTVTAPAGYYASSASKAVSAGTAGTPTATKGTVSNHSVSVTPSVTNTTGYITGSTKTGTAVTVSASELDSGTKSISSNGTGIDVVGYAAVDVNVSGTQAGTVYQDNDGYLVLDDGAGSHIQVDSLSVTENGTYTASSGHAYSPVVVNVSGGGGAAEEKQVNFYDYDGTRLYSYTAAEINSMESDADLPPNPSHAGLLAQGWNWTLSNIKSQLTDAPGGLVEVGQYYKTSTTDTTEIDITLEDSNYLSPYLVTAVNGTIVVDWGDQTSTNTVTGSSTSTALYTQHVYSATGDYTIKITVSSGTFAFVGSNQYDAGVLRTVAGAGSGASRARTYSSRIKHMRMGTGHASTLGGNYGLAGLSHLETITLPGAGVTAIGQYAFYGCYSLKYIVLPTTVSSLQYMAFSYCKSLKGVSRRGNGKVALAGSTFVGSGIEHYTMKSTDTTNDSIFQSCGALKEIVIPDGVTAIGQTNQFSDCANLTRANMPSGSTYIYTSAYSGCYSLGPTFTIPANVASISQYAFYTCYSIHEYHILRTTPPTLSDANAFGWVQYAGYIYVPYSSDHSILAAYKSASNWSSLADYIVEEPQS